MNTALALEKLVPAAQCFGQMSDNTKVEYGALRWNDTRTKPAWSELEAVWPEVEEEIKMEPIRKQRNELLDEIDLKYCNAQKWAAMTTAKQDEWTAYKQALRDLPATVDVDNPVWPTMPS